MTADDPIQDRMTKIAGQLLRRTLDGLISWGETDNENEFIYSGTSTSVTIRRRDTRDIVGRYILTVMNWRGTVVDTLESAKKDLGIVEQPEEWNAVLYDLYEAARRSALSIETVLDELLTELSTDEEAEPPPDESE